ncbi:MAG: peptidase M55 [Candidatus Aminicenantes bacterium]|nr:peptidase M55 [Candidatus Aminicenantes bacterium]
MCRKNVLILSFLFLAIFSRVGLSFGQEKLKIFISVDMEGIAGIVHSDQTSSSGKDYNIARRWMTKEVNAAILGAFEAGATEVVVNDSHGSMRNIIPSELNPKAYLVTGSPKPLAMMQGIDETFDAVIFIGYHARAGTDDGVLDHTYSGSSIHSIKINGLEMGEGEINAAIAGWYKVPVVLVTGDRIVCEQVKRSLGEELEMAAVKEGVGRYAAKSLTPEKAQVLIKEKTRIALEKRKTIKPFILDPPFYFEVNFLRSYMADSAELIPQVEKKGARTVVFTSNNFVEGFKLMRVLISLARR